MNKKTRGELERSAEIIRSMAAGKMVNLTISDLKLIPAYFCVMSPTAAKRKGLVLKRNAKRVGTIEWKIPGAGYGHGELYLGCSFKLKNENQQVNS